MTADPDFRRQLEEIFGPREDTTEKLQWGGAKARRQLEKADKAATKAMLRTEFGVCAIERYTEPGWIGPEELFATMNDKQRQRLKAAAPGARAWLREFFRLLAEQ